jgi:hypothetical protein
MSGFEHWGIKFDLLSYFSKTFEDKRDSTIANSNS